VRDIAIYEIMKIIYFDKTANSFIANTRLIIKYYVDLFILVGHSLVYRKRQLESVEFSLRGFECGIGSKEYSPV
jgi:hypothetical protein